MRPGLSPPQPPPPSTQISYPTPTPTPPAPGVRLSSQGQIKSLCNLHSHSIKSSPLRPLRNSCRDSALSVLLSCCREGRGSSPAGALHPRPPPHPAPSHPTLPYPALPDTHRQTFRQREGAASQKSHPSVYTRGGVPVSSFPYHRGIIRRNYRKRLHNEDNKPARKGSE